LGHSQSYYNVIYLDLNPDIHCKEHCLIRLAKANKKYSIDDLINVKPGDYIVLKGYPYEGTL